MTRGTRIKDCGSVGKPGSTCAGEGSYGCELDQQHSFPIAN